MRKTQVNMKPDVRVEGLDRFLGEATMVQRDQRVARAMSDEDGSVEIRRVLLNV